MKILILQEKIIKKTLTLMCIFAFLTMLPSCSTVTPLGRAAKKGDIKKVEALLNKGADVNEVRTPGLSPLHEAVFNNASLDIIRLLLDKGADINKKSCGDGWATTCTCGTPLHIAACKGNIKMMQLLIDRGAEIDALDHRNCTPLYEAAMAGQKTAIKLLLEKGADADIAKASLISDYAESAARVVEMTEKSVGKKKTQVPTSKETLSAVVKSDVDELPVGKVKQNKNAYAIVIGIENYRQKLPLADFAAHDARLVAEYLIKALGYPEENVVTLLNDRAAKSDFEKYFEKWLHNNVEPDSTVFIYYSGHGAPNPRTGDAYLVPYDGDPSFIDQTGYSLKRMYAALGKLPAKEIIVALDSCFSGAGGRSVLAEGARPLVMNLQTSFALSGNIKVMAAASGDQISSTYKDKGHGLFTYYLLKGIKNEDVVNSDGSIEISALYNYIKPQVERIARKQFNNEQTPQLIGGK